MITPLSNNSLSSGSAFSAGTQGVKAGLEQAQDNAAALARRGVEDSAQTASGISRASDDQTTVPNPTSAQNLAAQNPAETGQVGSGVQASLAADNAGELNSGSGVYSLESAVVGLKQAEQQVGASANVIRTADEVIGSLINTRA